jgi:hypothetical protein
MGLKLRGVVRCGACGQPRGITHLCNPGRRRRQRTRPQNPVTWECPACHKRRGLRHACSPRKGDFKARKRQAATAERQRKRRQVRARQAARRRQAAADRRAREKARRQQARNRRPRQGRPRGDGHEPGTCGNRDCERYGCQAYFAGVENCPLPHGG